MRTTSNYFIMNMAFGDILATLSIIFVSLRYFAVGFVWYDGIVGQIACKLIHYLEIVGILCSVFSLVALSFDRYLAVVHPLKYKCCFSWTKYLLLVIWLVSLVLPAHAMLVNVSAKTIPMLNDNKTYVAIEDSFIDAVFMALLGYILPHVAMVTMYIIIAYKLWNRRVPGAHVQDDPAVAAGQRTAKRITGMIVCILFIFNICWAATFFMICVVYFIPQIKSDVTFHDPVGVIVFCIAAIANGPMNFIIYCTFCQNFRTEFKSIFSFVKCRLCMSGRKHSLKLSSTNKTSIQSGHQSLPA